MKPTRLAALTLVALAVAPLFAQTPMRPGRWEINAQMEIPGSPMKMPPSVTTQCITAEQLKDPAGSLASGPPGQACKATDYKVDGNKVTWKMTCSGQMTMTGDGTLEFSGDTYTGVINGKMDQNAITMKLNGKRLGDCTK